MATNKLSVNRALNQFNGGEISPHLEGRFDWAKYNYSAKKCQNFIPMVEGCLKRRGGTHFVCATEETPVFEVKFVFTFNDEATADINATIDETSLIIQETEYVMNVELGETIDYSFKPNSYVGVDGSLYVDSDKLIEINFININDAVSVKIITDPEESDCWINGIFTKSMIVERNSSIDVRAKYQDRVVETSYVINEDKEIELLIDYIAFRSYLFEATEEITLRRGYYWVEAYGGTGGAGGGTYGDNHKSTGGGGGTGAYYGGNIKLEGKYTVNAGIWGKGGHNGNDYPENADGGDGTATYISGVIRLEGGKGGGKGRGKNGTGIPGKGGKAYIIDEEAVLNVAIDGNDAIGSKGAEHPSVLYPTKRGGDGVYKKNGKPGEGGRLIIKYNGSWR